MKLRTKAAAAGGIAALLALAACGESGGESGNGAAAPVASAPEQVPYAPAGPALVSADIADFYAARGDRPLWVAAGRLRPEALAAARTLSEAQAQGLDPERYRAKELAAAAEASRSGDRIALARAELLLSRGFGDYVYDLHTPAARGGMAYVEPGLAPEAPSPRALLEALAAAPSLGEALDAAQRTNPLYGSLVRGYAAWRARWAALPQVAIPPGPALRPGAQGRRVALLRRRLGLSGAGDRFDPALAAALRQFKEVHALPADAVADAATLAALNAGPAPYERRILANLDRARSIPALPGRYVLVDAGGARLWMIEDGHPVGTMRVVVGKPHMPTPAMAGRIRYAILNPYWNVPPDLARDRARRALRQGTGFLRRERLEALSDWSDSARVLRPSEVDWRGVAAGRRELRMRQLPGGANVMGAVKFMFPNMLGIYLHDTPNKSLFARADRKLSSGCVRLQDAPRLGAWLFGGEAPRPAGARPDQEVDLPAPVPVYITYLTAAPAPGGIAFRPDAYRRDRMLLAGL